jgi:small subunit ribosomal protein S14
MGKIKKNVNQRNLLKKIEYKRLAIKAISNNLKIDTKIRWKAQQLFFKLPIKSSITRVKNICILTGRSKSIYKKFKLSRIQLKFFITEGLIPGLSKYSW